MKNLHEHLDQAWSDGQRDLSRIKKFGKDNGLKVAGAGLGLTLVFGSGIAVANHLNQESGNKIELATPKTSEAGFDFGKIFGAKIAEAADLLRISSPEEAARTYGADDYTRDSRHWEINEFGGAHLIPDSNGNVHAVNVRNDVWEGYNEGKNPDPKGSGGVGVRAQAFVIDGEGVPGDQKIVDMRGGTVWRFTSETHVQGRETLWGQVTDKERREQPGIAVWPVGFRPGVLPSCPQIDP